jgi:sterol 3beta-glucosyltransferase
VSEHVLPRPREWGANVHQTGFWYLDQAAGFIPPPALQAFLDAGDPPVYIGFGSMSDRDPAGMGALVRDAVRRACVRAVILSGWGGIDAADDERVFMLDAAPHDWLFPRMAAVVHHGGIGTMAEAARAGVPQVIVAYSADQPFWGEQTRRIGVSPAWFRRYGVTAERLAAAIRAALDNAALGDRAAALAGRLRAEDGVGRAAEVIGKLG